MSAPSLRIRDIAWFFFPLVLNVQLMSISHTIINGALARLDNYVTALAGISVAMVVHVFIASPSYQNHTITMTLARGRQSTRGVILFILLVASYVAVMLLLIAYSALGEWLLTTLLGATGEIIDEARGALKIMVFLPFFTGFRGFAQGLLMRSRRTALVSLATGVRVAFLFVYLWLGDRFFDGAQLGAFALVGCVMTESLVISWLAWRSRTGLASDNVAEKSSREIFSYAFPLAYSSCLQQTVPLLITTIIGRFSDAAIALAAFGVIRGFLFLLAGPMRNLQQTYLALVKSPADQRLLIRFSISVALAMGVLVLLTAGPLNQLFLGHWLGVESDLLSYLQLPLACCAIFPLFYAFSNLLRGWFAGADKTSQLGLSTAIKTTFLLLLWWPLVAWQPAVPGVLVAVMLLLGAELLEASYLFWQRHKLPVQVRHLAPL